MKKQKRSLHGHALSPYSFANFDDYLIILDQTIRLSLFEKRPLWYCDSGHACYVYFISDGSYIKIGVAKDVATRIIELQCGNPHDLSLVFLLPLEDSKIAFRVEKGLHKLYNKFRVRGEWFDILEHLYDNHYATPLTELTDM